MRHDKGSIFKLFKYICRSTIDRLAPSYIIEQWAVIDRHIFCFYTIRPHLHLSIYINITELGLHNAANIYLR